MAIAHKHPLQQVRKPESFPESDISTPLESLWQSSVICSMLGLIRMVSVPGKRRKATTQPTVNF